MQQQNKAQLQMFAKTKTTYAPQIILSVNQLQAQQTSEITVRINQRVNTVPSAMWGIFFEDINFAADGGIYAELVKNRSFSFNDPMMGWKWLKKGGGNGDGRLYNSER